MGSKRLKHPPGEEGYYHVMSRIAGQEPLLGDAEKETFRRLMRRVAIFSGLEIVTYAIMDNHFHAVVRVPLPRELSDSELLERYRALYPKPTPWNRLGPQGLRKLLARGGTAAVRKRNSLKARMHDVSWFCRTLKQRYTRWFNSSHQRKGTLWSERFAAVLVEPGRALRAVCAYVDLNPVRAGLVHDPAQYRFCGYAEACGGSKAARKGLLLAEKDLPSYRIALFGSGSAPKDGKAAISREDALHVIETQKGLLPLACALRLRLRYMLQGRVLGSHDFVQKFAPLASARKSPKPSPLQGAHWDGIHCLGRLRKNLFR